MEFLTSSKWNGISALTALIALFISLFVGSPKKEPKLILYATAKEGFPGINGSVYDEAKQNKYDIAGLWSVTYILDNRGNEAITPEDIKQNIQITTANNCTIISAISTFDSGLRAEWSPSVDKTKWSLSPFLLNPGEHLFTSILLGGKPPYGAVLKDVNSWLTWSGRIKDVKFPTPETIIPPEDTHYFLKWSIANLGSEYYGAQMFRFVMMTIFLSSLLFWIYAPFINAICPLHLKIPATIALFGFAFSCADALSYIVETRTVFGTFFWNYLLAGALGVVLSAGLYIRRRSAPSFQERHKPKKIRRTPNE